MASDILVQKRDGHLTLLYHDLAYVKRVVSDIPVGAGCGITSWMFGEVLVSGICVIHHKHVDICKMFPTSPSKLGFIMLLINSVTFAVI